MGFQLDESHCSTHLHCLAKKTQYLALSVDVQPCPRSGELITISCAPCKYRGRIDDIDSCLTVRCPRPKSVYKQPLSHDDTPKLVFIPLNSLTLDKNNTQPFIPLPSIHFIYWQCSPPRYDFPNLQIRFRLRYWLSFVDLRSFGPRLLPFQRWTSSSYHRWGIPLSGSRGWCPRCTRNLWWPFPKEA